MVKSKQHKSYQALFPKDLHLKVQALLDYLTFYPYQIPTQCPHCASSKFHKMGKIFRAHGDTNNPQYFCNACKRNFTQLTNTIFSNSYYLDLWGTLGALYLAGVPRRTLCIQLNISPNSYYRYTKKINSLMQAQYPDLYDWWQTHQLREDLTFTKEIAQQADLFYRWLNHLIYSREYNCPKCNRKMHKKDYKTIWPRFVCYPCKHSFNALDGTELRGLLYIELWPNIAKLFIEGSTDTDIYRSYKIQTKTISIWRKRFTMQMKALKLFELVKWMEWQAKRRLIQTQFNKRYPNKNVKQKNHNKSK